MILTTVLVQFIESKVVEHDLKIQQLQAQNYAILLQNERLSRQIAGIYPLWQLICTAIPEVSSYILIKFFN